MLHHAFLAVLAEIPALVRDEISLRCSDTDTPQALLTCTDTNPAGLQAISAGGTQHTCSRTMRVGDGLATSDGAARVSVFQPNVWLQHMLDVRNQQFHGRSHSD
jgi:hypothetical protein